MSIRKKIKYMVTDYRKQEIHHYVSQSRRLSKQEKVKGGTGVKKTCTGQTVCGLNSVINISTHQM